MSFLRLFFRASCPSFNYHSCRRCSPRSILHHETPDTQDSTQPWHFANTAAFDGRSARRLAHILVSNQASLVR